MTFCVEPGWRPGSLLVSVAVFPVSGVFFNSVHVAHAQPKPRALVAAPGLIREKKSQKNTCFRDWHVWNEQLKTTLKPLAWLPAAFPDSETEAPCLLTSSLQPGTLALWGRPPLGPVQAAPVLRGGGWPQGWVCLLCPAPRTARSGPFSAGWGGGVCLLPAQTGPVAKGINGCLAGFQGHEIRMSSSLSLDLHAILH